MKKVLYRILCPIYWVLAVLVLFWAYILPTITLILYYTVYPRTWLAVFSVAIFVFDFVFVKISKEKFAAMNEKIFNATVGKFGHALQKLRGSEADTH